MGEQVELLGERGLGKIESKGLIVCWNKENKRVWLEMSDCLFASGGKGAGPVGGTVCPN